MPLPWKRNLPPEPSRENKTRSRTEKIAYELYQTRQLLKRSGDIHTDWALAERIVQSQFRLVLYRCHRPFIQLEKTTWEPLLAWANNQALLSLLGLIGNIGLIIAVATYIGSEKQRRNAEVLNAWQTITNSHGQAGSGGRIQSLEFLNASPGANWRRKFPWVCAPSPICLWSRESLDGINLAVEGFDNVVETNREELSDDDAIDVVGKGVFLMAVQLPKAYLNSANLQGAELFGANLEGAYLNSANLDWAHLPKSNLKEAHLFDASLQEAYLYETNLQGAYLNSTNLEGANLSKANLEGAELFGANLEGADLSKANLEGAELFETNLEGADLSKASLEGTELWNVNLEKTINLTTEQLTEAKFCKTQFPENVYLSSNRDCEELDPSF